MTPVLDYPSLRRISARPMTRHGEKLLVIVDAEMIIVGDDDDDPIDAYGQMQITVSVPCEYVRRHGEQKAREYLGNKMRSEILSFGPISYQRLAAAVMDRALQHNMESMAGEPFLFGLNCGRPH